MGRLSLLDDACPGSPVIVATPEMVNKVHDIVMADKRVREKYLSHDVASWSDFTPCKNSIMTTIIIFCKICQNLDVFMPKI